MGKTIGQLALVWLLSLASGVTCAVLLPFAWAGTTAAQILVTLTVLVVSLILLSLLSMPLEAKWAAVILVLLAVLGLGGYLQRSDTPPSLQHALLGLLS